MTQRRQYEIEGVVLDVPLQYDQKAKCYIEDYTFWLEEQRYTAAGHPIMFAGEDACTFAQEATPGGCPDCGSCRFYRRAGDHTWIGICKYEHTK